MKKVILFSFLIFSVITCNIFALETNMQKDYNTQSNECSIEISNIETNTAYANQETMNVKDAEKTEGQFFRKAFRRFIKWLNERIKNIDEKQCSPSTFECGLL